jgi:hypothetical protein
MYLRNNEPAAGPILAALTDRVRDCSDEVDRYLAHIMGNDPIPQEFLGKLGISHLAAKGLQWGMAMEGHWQIESDKDDQLPQRWENVRNDAIITGLRAVMSAYRVIQFADWAKVADASSYWDGLCSDVIKPLRQRDFDFIFHLGDITKRLVFEVDEVLDIIGDYSSYGRVTLVMDEREAGELWSRLNGEGPVTKGLFLFNTMKVDVLLILSDDGAAIFSKDWQFDFAGRMSKHITAPVYDKECFSAGFQLGTLLHPDVPPCIALGLAVSGSYVAHGGAPDAQALVAYLHDWMAELQAADGEK